MTPLAPSFTKFISDARAAAAKLEDAANKTAAKLETAAAKLETAATKTADKLALAAVKLENEFVKLGDGIINEPESLQQQLFFEQKLRKATIILQQMEIERQIRAQNKQQQAQSQTQPAQPQHDAFTAQAIVEESRQQCMQIMEEHLERFLDSHPDASFEEWIADLHPQNATESGGDVVIDHRFLIPGNPWYAAFEEATSTREAVPVPPENIQRVLTC
jgi:hypothetical protein